MGGLHDHDHYLQCAQQLMDLYLSEENGGGTSIIHKEPETAKLVELGLVKHDPDILVVTEAGTALAVKLFAEMLSGMAVDISYLEYTKDHPDERETS